MHTNVVRVDPRSDLLWQRFVEKTNSSLFHSPNWISVLTDTYGWDARAYLVLDDSGEPCSGLPFCSVTDILGERIVALPFSDYCDPLTENADSWCLIVGRLLIERCPIQVRCLHNTVPLGDERFTLLKDAKWHRLDLRPCLEDLWRGIDNSAQRAIRKSEREGLTVRVAETEAELRSFFEMHLKIRKYKYGLLAQPYSFFQSIWRRFVVPKHGFLLLAIHEDKIVAGDFFLDWKDTLYYKFNASLADDLPLRPNDLLIWKGIQLGKSQGLKYLDFGLSDTDQEGLVRYKRKFGTEEKTISFLRCAPTGESSFVEKEIRKLLSRLTMRFTDKLVPDSVTEQAGEDLYGLFA